jgi:hypothetical protein
MNWSRAALVAAYMLDVLIAAGDLFVNVLWLLFRRSRRTRHTRLFK